jgi:hypothetical protein
VICWRAALSYRAGSVAAALTTGSGRAARTQDLAAMDEGAKTGGWTIRCLSALMPAISAGIGPIKLYSAATCGCATTV